MNNDRVQYVSCLYSGQPESAGMLLHCEYTTAEKVNQLLRGGDIEGLCKNVNECIFVRPTGQHVDNSFYANDLDSFIKTMKSEVDFIYLFDDGRWSMWINHTINDGEFIWFEDVDQYPQMLEAYRVNTPTKSDDVREDKPLELMSVEIFPTPLSNNPEIYYVSPKTGIDPSKLWDFYEKDGLITLTSKAKRREITFSLHQIYCLVKNV